MKKGLLISVFSVTALYASEGGVLFSSEITPRERLTDLMPEEQQQENLLVAKENHEETTLTGQNEALLLKVADLEKQLADVKLQLQQRSSEQQPVVKAEEKGSWFWIPWAVGGTLILCAQMVRISSAISSGTLHVGASEEDFFSDEMTARMCQVPDVAMNEQYQAYGGFRQYMALSYFKGNLEALTDYCQSL